MADRTIKSITMGFICVLIFAMLIIALTACSNTRTKQAGMYYAKSAVVTTINNVRNYVGFTDVHGDEWYWYCDTATAPWVLDDEVLLVMYNSGTEYMYDDVMVSITTEGIITEVVTN